jgi:hemerythrin-like metal-binding protein
VNKANREGMMQVLKDLENYTIIHFATEEKMMKNSNYPGLSFHKEEHQKFIETVSDYQKRFKNGRLLLSLEVTGFIKNWITEHIMKTDQLYKGKLG